MLVSWDWLKQYVPLAMTPDELAERLMMAGLNHEATEQRAADVMIHLEVTSNRPDCLGHLGIAREAAVLCNLPFTLPAADPKHAAVTVGTLTAVELDAPALCYRYTARVVRGVKVGPSPAWLVNRLATIGIASINNIVDVTNYVLMECGQPLHAFDLTKLAGRKIVVREARAGETLLAINHKTYNLSPGMCVIADAEKPVALAGVMGGAETEVTAATTDVLIESAEFDPMSIRTTARKLSLHSDSSYRFERGLDPEGIAWASRRACELILEVAGGQLAEGVLDVGRKPPPREPIALRYRQLERVLGIDVTKTETCRILTALGNRQIEAGVDRVVVTPPSWRRDLTREIDLVEEVARIHGYDKIPEDARVPMVPSHRTRHDRVTGRVRQVLQAAGFDEALTLSAVEETWSEAFSPWTTAAALRAYTPVLRRADRLRRSLVPSLLGARRTNESLSNPVVELFETASAYLPSEAGLPREMPLLTLASGRSFGELKGVVQALVAGLGSRLPILAVPTRHELLDAERSCELRLGSAVDAGASGDTAGGAVNSEGTLLGYLGAVSAAGLKRFELRTPCTIAELSLDALVAAAELIPQSAELSIYPAVARDLNLELPLAVRWAQIDRTVRAAAGPKLDSLEFREDFRDTKYVPAGFKRLLFGFTLRSQTGTLTSEEADTIRDRIVNECQRQFGARLSS